MLQLEKLSRLFECKTEEAWTRSLFSIANEYGFQYTLFYVLHSKKRPLKTALFKSNHPLHWRSRHERLQSLLADPPFAAGLNDCLPLVWTRERLADDEERSFYDQLCGEGTASGICYPVHGTQGEFGMLTFSGYRESNAMQQGPGHQTLATLSLARDYLFASSVKFFNRIQPDPISVKLTGRELQCLKLMMDGKSSWEMSTILHCSEATINFHASNLRKKFDVRTRQQVIVKAIKEGIVSLA